MSEGTTGHDDSRKGRPYDKGNRKGGYRKGGPRRDRGSDDGSEGRREYGHRDNDRRGYRPRDGDRRHRDNDRHERRELKPRDGDYRSSNGEHREGRDGDRRERRDFRPRDGDRRERREFKPRDGDRRPRDNDRRERREFRPRDGERRDRRPFDGDRRPRNDSFRDRREHAPKDEEVRTEPPVEEQVQTESRLRIPSDPQKILFRGIDCQANGREELALILFLHGSVMMSKGCENNALAILRDKPREELPVIRSNIVEQCSEDAMIEFDYLCHTLYRSYDRSFFDSRFGEGNNHAIYRRICLEEIEGDDDVIDLFASRHDTEPQKVAEGLKFIKRKKDSVKAEKHLERFDEEVRTRQAVRVEFSRAVKGDEYSLKELKAHSKTVPEAAFFLDYISAKADGNEIEWLREKMPQFGDLIVSVESNLGIKDTPFGLYLRAKALQSKKEEWIPAMIKAAKSGSEEALSDLEPVMFKTEVRKAVATVHMNNGDLPRLLLVYQMGLEEPYYLDQYCGCDPQKVIEVGRELGKQSIAKEIDWLKDHVRDGMEECRTEMISKASDDLYRGKKLIYALHDIGEDMEAAKLYFDMGDDPELPSVKWLKKVCETEEVRDFVRHHYEEIHQLGTFDSIFIDDGYKKKSQGRKFQKRDGRRR